MGALQGDEGVKRVKLNAYCSTTWGGGGVEN